MLDFFKRKCSNSSDVNVGLPTTNVAIPIPENVDAPILENVDAPILENVEDAPILENVDAPILENVHFSIPENVDVPISQTQFQRVDLDSLDYDPGTRKQIWEYHRKLVRTFYNVSPSNFITTIDSQLQELNYRFNEDAMELLRLSSALEPREALKSFRSSDLCLLVENFYPQDFTDYDKQVLKKELYHFEHNVVQDPEFKELKSLSELSQWLVRTRNSEHYKLFYRMVRLVLTLPVSTATTERAFSAMKIVKTNLRNKMEDDFLTDSLMLYIEKDIASTFSLDSIVDDFENLKERRVPFS
ncbi:uncharacterized protein LOC112027883 [Quercus suber]|uniref:uncharacterized protein LOC112027883 n=1 Tax=Quercus suber TaxID=58331 RepID=UPI0032DF729A